MPSYVRGNAVPNAVSYTLYNKKNGEYNQITTKISGKRTLSVFRKGEGIDYRGQVTVVSDTQINISRTNMINISDLEDNENGVCAYISPLASNITNSYSAVSFYSEENVFSSSVLLVPYNEIAEYLPSMSTEDFKFISREYGAKYVIFCSEYKDTNFVNFHKDINIKLDDISTKLLPEGERHTLVVEADGDGIEYEDSYYSNEVYWDRPVTPI